MKITLNGKSKELAYDLSINELLKLENVPSPEMVAVELNEEMLPKDIFDSTKLKEGDTVEFLYFMGGGQVC